MCGKEIEQCYGKRPRWTCSDKCRKARSRKEQKRRNSREWLKWRVDYHTRMAIEVIERSGDLVAAEWHDEQAEINSKKLEKVTI